MKAATQSDVNNAIELFLGLANNEESEMAKFQTESAPWWTHRDKYISFSNTAAQLMGEKTANPFI